MTPKKAVASLTVAALVAAGMAVIWRHRQGQRLRYKDYQNINELHALLSDPERAADPHTAKRLTRILTQLEAAGIGSKLHLQHLLRRLKSGDISDEEAVQAEHHLDEIDARARQDGL